jgi:hypothetical protein
LPDGLGGANKLAHGDAVIVPPPRDGELARLNADHETADDPWPRVDADIPFGQEYDAVARWHRFEGLVRCAGLGADPDRVARRSSSASQWSRSAPASGGKATNGSSSISVICTARRRASRCPAGRATYFRSLRSGSTWISPCEALNAIFGASDLTVLRRRLLGVVTTFRADIDAGDSRTCQAAVEELSESFAELTTTDVGDNPVTRLRAEQSGVRRALLRVYHLQREEFIPSAYVMIVAIIASILVLVTLTDFGGLPESLTAVGFLSFFFLALLRLLDIISTPFKVGAERSDDDVSLFQLSEFVVQVQASETGETVTHDIETLAEEVEEQLVEAEEQEDDPALAAERAKSTLTQNESSSR